MSAGPGEDKPVASSGDLSVDPASVPAELSALDVIAAQADRWPSDRRKMPDPDAKLNVGIVALASGLGCFPCMVVPAFLFFVCYLCYQEICVLATGSGRLRTGQFDLKTMMICTLACTVPCLCLRAVWRDADPITLVVAAVVGLVFGLAGIHVARGFAGEVFELTRFSGGNARKYQWAQRDAQFEDWMRSLRERE